jgi:DNA-binding NarL/FixJ family response regulator
MIIHDFVEKELEYFRKECNFTEDELKYFNLKAKGKTNIFIAMEMNVSERTVNNISKKVKKKIIKVL